MGAMMGELKKEVAARMHARRAWVESPRTARLTEMKA